MALTTIKEFLNSRHNFDEKNGISEALNKQRNFFNLYDQTFNIPNGMQLTEEQKIIYTDCLDVLKKAIVILDFSIGTMIEQTENHISSLKSELASTIRKTQNNITRQEAKAIKALLGKLKNSINALNSFSDIYNLRMQISEKMLSLTVAHSVPGKRISLARLFSTNTSLQESAMHNLLSALLQKLPQIDNIEELQEFSTKAKTFNPLQRKDSEYLVERFSTSFTLDDALLNTLTYRSTMDDIADLGVDYLSDCSSDETNTTSSISSSSGDSTKLEKFVNNKVRINSMDSANSTDSKTLNSTSVHSLVSLSVIGIRTRKLFGKESPEIINQATAPKSSYSRSISGGST